MNKLIEEARSFLNEESADYSYKSLSNKDRLAFKDFCENEYGCEILDASQTVIMIGEENEEDAVKKFKAKLARAKK